MQKTICFQVTGTVSRIRLYLDDERILLDKHGVGLSQPRRQYENCIVNYSGIGFRGATINIKMENTEPSHISDKLDCGAKMLLGQKLIQVV